MKKTTKSFLLFTLICSPYALNINSAIIEAQGYLKNAIVNSEFYLRLGSADQKKEQSPILKADGTNSKIVENPDYKGLTGNLRRFTGLKPKNAHIMSMQHKNFVEHIQNKQTSENDLKILRHNKHMIASMRFFNRLDVFNRVLGTIFNPGKMKQIIYALSALGFSSFVTYKVLENANFDFKHKNILYRIPALSFYWTVALRATYKLITGKYYTLEKFDSTVSSGTQEKLLQTQVEGIPTVKEGETNSLKLSSEETTQIVNEPTENSSKFEAETTNKKDDPNVPTSPKNIVNLSTFFDPENNS